MNRQQLYKLLLVVVCAALLAGCDSGSLPSLASTQPTAETPTFTVSGRPSDASGDCQITVKISRPAINLEVDVTVELENGVVFTENKETKITAKNIKLLAMAERVLTWECSLVDEALILSGEYIVKAVATFSGSSQVYEQASSKMFIYVRDAGAELLAKQAEFDSQFANGFHPGRGDCSYSLALDTLPQHASGWLYVKMTSSADGFAPSMGLRMLGGVEFVADAADRSPSVRFDGAQLALVAVDAIAEGGSRIVALPFRVDPNTNVSGTYNFEMTEYAGGTAVAEVAPVAIQVVVADGFPEYKTLEAEYHGAAWPVEPSNLDKVMAIAGAGATAPVTSAESAPPPPPPPPTPTPAPPVEARDEVSAESPPPAPPVIVWTRALTGLTGTRLALWESHVQGRLPQLDYWAFQAEFSARNPHFVADGYVLHPDKTYLLPAIAADSAEQQATQ